MQAAQRVSLALACASVLCGVSASTARAQTATLVRSVQTSQFSPPSPDPAGIVYLPRADRLMLTDSEVNEMPIYAGVNAFHVTRTGVLVAGTTTTGFTNEPTGATYDPATGTVYITDDDWDEVYVVTPGPDGLVGTGDDTVTSFDTRAFNCFDPEGVAFDTALGALHIADGFAEEVFTVRSGFNGAFDGVPPQGDDTVTSFDTTSLGMQDPEGIAYDPAQGHLYLVGRPKYRLVHCTTSGDLLRTLDISAAAPFKPAGLTFAPDSNGQASTHLYVVDRGVDNDQVPTENDGRMYELSIPAFQPGHDAPTADAGPDQSVNLPDVAVLDGIISDDGLPNPPGFVTAHWSVLSGPGSVTFGNANAAVTTASFSGEGLYVLRLTADDSELSATDDIAITAIGASGALTLDQRVASSSDDAEERAGGSVKTNSSDLELVFDAGGNQVVGLRFADLGIPQGSLIEEAYVQFQVDESGSTPTSLTIRGHDTNDSAPFAGSFNISSRPVTSASAFWSPPSWNSVGVAGAAQRTPELAAIVQEIVDRPGWLFGGALSLIISGSGERTAESFEGNQAAAPLLHVKFIPEQLPPSVSAGSDVAVQMPAAALLDGTVSDDGLPNPPGVVTTLWSQVSGPGTASFANPSAIDTSVTFDMAGDYVLRLSGDDGAVVVTDDLLATVVGSGGETVFEVRVSESRDDAEERINGTVSLTSSDLELVYDSGGNQHVGVRFQGIAIPPGAVIDNAWIQFQCDETRSSSTSLLIEGQAADNAAIFANTTANISSRSRTNAAIPWTVPAWLSVGQAGAAQRTPDLASVVQEIVDRGGWLQGGSLAFIITGSGERAAESFNGDPSGAPLLHVVYH